MKIFIYFYAFSHVREEQCHSTQTTGGNANGTILQTRLHQRHALQREETTSNPITENETGKRTVSASGIEKKETTAADTNTGVRIDTAAENEIGIEAGTETGIGTEIGKAG